MRTSAFIVIVTVAMLFLSGMAEDSSADSLDSQLRVSAEAIAKYCESEGAQQIAVGSFNGPGIGGVGFAAKFETHLKDLGIHVVAEDDDYEYKIQGRYQLFPEGTDVFEEIDIQIELVDELGAAAKELNDTYVVDSGQIKAKEGVIKLKTSDPPEMSVILGKSTYFGNSGHEVGSPQYKSDQLGKLQDTIEDKPHRYVDDSAYIVKLTEKSPYGVQILVGGHPRKAEIAGSKIRVIIHKGEIFTVRIHNNDQYDAAVELSMDGINTFGFSEIKGKDGYSPAYKHWIIPRGSPADVQGWFINHEEIDKFMITGFKDSAVFKAKGKADKLSGAIVATFSYAWDPHEKPPHDLVVNRSEQSEPFVGFGGREHVKTKKVEKQIGPVREVIVIHYRDR